MLEVATAETEGLVENPVALIPEGEEVYLVLLVLTKLLLLLVDPYNYTT